jgi:arylsulfatase A-like enzyme
VTGLRRRIAALVTGLRRRIAALVTGRRRRIAALVTGRRRRIAAVCIAALALATACDAPAPPPAGPPQRIVLIVIDTLRRDHLSAYGSAVETPEIDALAARGQLYTNVLASFHQTTMSMAALFTGRTPSLELEGGQTLFWNSKTWCGMRRFTADDDPVCLPRSLPTLAASMREAGYWTLGVTSNHFLFRPGGYERGFDQWVEVGDPAPEDGEAEDEALESLPWWRPVNRAVTEALNRRETDQFFLYVHYMDVHDYWRRNISYADAVRVVDVGVGRLLHELERAGLLEDAVVVLTSDHGERLHEGHPVQGRAGHLGNPSFMELLRVPLIVAPAIPGDPQRRLRGEDVFDLLRNVAGLAPRDEAELAPDELFVSEVDYRTLLKGRWKGSERRSDGAFLLFDLQTDPDEKRDVSALHPKVAQLLAARIAFISGRLSAHRAVEPSLPPEDRERLRILGYLEESEPSRAQ